MPSLFQIVTNTPLWVWPLMAFVLWLGVQGLRPRVIPWWRLAILPAVGLATSLGGIAQSANPVWAATGWALALLAFLPGLGLWPEPGGAAAPRGWQAGDRRRLVRTGVRRLDLRRALCDGRAVRRLPALRGEAFWICLSGAVGGMVAGIGIGWLANLLRRARRSTEVAPCA